MTEITARTGKVGNVVFTAVNIETALSFVKDKQSEGIYMFFRGQENAKWNPTPSFLRIREEGEIKSARQRLDRFHGYTQNAARSCGVTYSSDSIIAIAQHYGLPTTFLDLTTNPIVAGTFACPPDSEHSDSLAAILLFKEEQIQSWADYVLRKTGQVGIELIRLDVENLWRLQAQEGLFLYLNISNFFNSFAPDRIEFPHPANGFSDPDCNVYPKAKSPLEIQLDLYFDLERKEQAKKVLDEIADVVFDLGSNEFQLPGTTPRISSAKLNAESPVWLEDERKVHGLLRGNLYNIPDTPLRTLPNGFYVSCWKYRNGELPPHPSWFTASAKSWLSTRVQDLKEAVPAAHDLVEVELEPNASVEKSALQTKGLNLHRGNLDRSKSHRFSLSHPALQFWENQEYANETINHCNFVTRNLWDGIRSLPISDIDLWACLDECLVFTSRHLERISAANYKSDQFYGKENVDHVKVEYSGIGGHSRSAMVMCSELRKAVRPDMDELVETSYEAGKVDSFGFPPITQMLYPQYLFDFDAFVQLFFRSVLPYQAYEAVLVTNSKPALFFNPRQIKIFGLA